MICLIQRVSQAHVSIHGQRVGEIEHGLLALCGFQPQDTHDHLLRMQHKLLHYRVFADDGDKMNLNVQQVGGGLLLVPQFTLAADTHKGLRPSFHTSAKPDIAQQHFNQFVSLVQTQYENVATGRFGADMQVALINDGPVTFWLET